MLFFGEDVSRPELGLQILPFLIVAMLFERLPDLSKDDVEVDDEAKFAGKVHKC